MQAYYLIMSNQKKMTMKKIYVLAIVVFCSTFAVSAGESGENALGVRFGYGGEVSYQRMLGSYNRLEIDAGWNSKYLGVAGIYHWVWDLSNLGPGFKWYAGIGAQVGIHESDFALGIAGDIGIEYNFTIPLQLSLDYRPTFYLIPGTDFSASNAGFSIRYKF